jgi:predicted  nucleic acid-binding Zn-ribbon protein
MDAPAKASKKPYFIFFIFLTVLLSGYVFLSLFFLSRVQDLGKKNQSLRDESKKLEAALDSFKAEDKTLIEKIENDKKGLKDSLDSLKKENESLQLSLQKIEIQYKNATEEKHSLEEILVNKTNEIENLKAHGTPSAVPLESAPPATQFAPNTPEDVVQKIREKDEQIRTLAEQNRLYADKLDKLYKSMNEKITQISIAKIALEETVNEAKKKLNEEWNTVNLGSIDLTKGTAAAPAASAAGQTPAPGAPKKEGKILAVNEEQGFVVVDLGKVDNIAADSKLIVKRDGHYIGTLSVLEIRDVMSACHIKIIQENQKIQVNDLVTLGR